MDNLEFLKQLNLQIMVQINALEKDKHERKQLLIKLNEPNPKKLLQDSMAVLTVA